MAGGGSGPVNYDLARKLASSSIGFTAPIPEATSKAVADAVHLADTWLDGASALPAGATKTAAWTPQDWVDNTMDTWKRLCDPGWLRRSRRWTSALPEEAKAMAGPLMAMMSQMGGMAFGSAVGPGAGPIVRGGVDLYRCRTSSGAQGCCRPDARRHRDLVAGGWSNRAARS